MTLIEQGERRKDIAEIALEKTENWRAKFHEQADVLREFNLVDPSLTENLLWPYSEFLYEAIQESRDMEAGELIKTEICGQEFEVLKQDAADHWQSPAYYILPSGKEAPFDTSLFFEQADIYTHGYYEIMNANRDFAEVIPSPFTIFTPDEWNVNGVEVNQEAWVNDFGPAVFHFKNGTLELTGRGEGNSEHENFHRRTAIKNTRLYLEFLINHDSINEAFAEALSLLIHSPEKTRNDNISKGVSNPSLVELPIGNALNYYQNLKVKHLLDPLDFSALDGHGKFDSQLYIKRFPLAVLIAVLASSRAIKPGTEYETIDDFVPILNSGLRNIDISRIPHPVYKQQGVLRIIKTMDNLEKKAQKGDTINADVVWQEFFDSTYVSEKKIENLYKTSAPILLPLFTQYKRIYGGYLVEEWWNTLKPEIQNMLRRYCPYFSKLPHSYSPFLVNDPITKLT